MNTNEQDLPPIPDQLPPVEPADPLGQSVVLPDLTPLFNDGLEEIGRIENGHLIRTNETPLLYKVEGSGLREPSISTVSEFDYVRINMQCHHNAEWWLSLTIPTATLLELLERAAAQHPLWAPTLLSHLFTVRGLFKTK